MLSAPHIIAAMIEVSLPAGLTAPDFTRVDGRSTCSPINSERPVCSASSSTGTNPADDTRFCSSNTADPTVNVYDDCTENAFQNSGQDRLQHSYCPSSFLKERGRSRPRLVVFSLVCELPDPGWRAEIGVGGQGSGGARPRKRPQGLDGDAVRRTLFRTGESKRLVLLSLAEQGGRCRLQGRFPGVGQARGLPVIPSPRCAA